MMKPFAVLIIAALTIVPMPALGGGHILQTDGTAWARKDLRGSQARLMAARGAQIVASRNLLATQVPPHYPPPPTGRHYLTGTVRGHYYLPPRHFPDGRATVTTQLPWPPP